jgi:hypothetical protein
VRAALGEAFLMTGRRPEAIASFKKALELDSLNTVAREYLRHVPPTERKAARRTGR